VSEEADDEEDDEDEHVDGECDACHRELEEDENIVGCPDGREICRDCFEAGVG
jgi:hypothetical protein